VTSYYLAASWKRKDEMCAIRQELVNMGHRVTARWLDVDETVIPEGGVSEHPYTEALHASMDITDIVMSDETLVFTGVPSTTGGYHTELGIAIGQQKRITIIGPRENVFQTLALLKKFDTWEDFRFFLRQKEQ
jgi:hypothetical protein